jgi:hypothetical protein
VPDDRDPFDDDVDDRPRRPRRRAYDDLDEPRWGDERDDYDDLGGARGRPEDRARAAGTALAAVGWAGLALTLLALAVALAVGLNNPPPEDDLIVNLVVGGVLGAIGVVYFAVIAAGGHRMRRCRGYGLAMTAGVLAIASFALFGLCSVPILPFGIWAVVVLADASVKRAFDRPRPAYD